MVIAGFNLMKYGGKKCEVENLETWNLELPLRQLWKIILRRRKFCIDFYNGYVFFDAIGRSRGLQRDVVYRC
jgi:hypothetical protein